MAFRKRNVVLSRPDKETQSAAALTPVSLQPQSLPGVRPSSIDGRSVTSTGTPSFDSLLAGHSGLPLGTSVLIEESGTTDFAGALLRFYASEGIIQGHVVHVVGVGEAWGRELPGLADVKDAREDKAAAEKMKIAWRYQSLVQAERNRVSPAPQRGPPGSDAGLDHEGHEQPPVFCHTFDLAKRLPASTGSTINYIPIHPQGAASPFEGVIQNLQRQLKTLHPTSVHRLVIPSILSPALYPPAASHPHLILSFLHSLRALLRQHANSLTALITLPIELYPRSSGVVRWMEILSDGVLELTPFPHHVDSLAASGAATAGEEKPHGILKIHRLPVFHEKGGGGGARSGLGDDLAFTASRRKFFIAKFSLPPLEGDREAQEGVAIKDGGSGSVSKAELEF